MKKFICIAILAILMFTMTSCKENQENNNNSENQSSSTPKQSNNSNGNTSTPSWSQGSLPIINTSVRVSIPSLKAYNEKKEGAEIWQGFGDYAFANCSITDAKLEKFKVDSLSVDNAENLVKKMSKYLFLTTNDQATRNEENFAGIDIQNSSTKEINGITYFIFKGYFRCAYPDKSANDIFVYGYSSVIDNNKGVVMGFNILNEDNESINLKIIETLDKIMATSRKIN